MIVFTKPKTPCTLPFASMSGEDVDDAAFGDRTLGAFLDHTGDFAFQRVEAPDTAFDLGKIALCDRVDLLASTSMLRICALTVARATAACLTSSAFTLVASSQVHALDLPTAIRKSLDADPRIEAGNLEVEAAKGARLQAGKRPNPELSVEVEDFFGNGLSHPRHGRALDDRQ
jgi:hypothetical protein